MRDAGADARRLSEQIEASAETVRSLLGNLGAIEAACELLVVCLRQGGKVLTAGNGGSAAEALHMAEELVGRFRGDRLSLAGLALVADTTALTCIANDYGYDYVFSRQVEGVGREGDVLMLFSTSGNARNLSMACDAARARGMRVISVLGRDGGPLAGRGDVDILVAGSATERIQEAHQVLVHLFLDAVEAAFA